MANESNIECRFALGKDTSTLAALYSDVLLTIQWPCDKEGNFDQGAVMTLLNNLPSIIKNFNDEAYVRRQARILDTEVADFLEAGSDD